MIEAPREDDRTVEAPVTTPLVALSTAPGLRTLDLGTGLGLDAGGGMVCDIDDPDCNPMAFAGTAGAPSGAADEA
jgi:hypothetical protein